MIDQLNARFAVDGACRVESGAGGMAKVALASAGGARAEVYLHGAHVTRWTDAAGRDGFFLSGRAVFQEDKPIRGGIPVIFPQFGPGALPAHGLVRTMRWEIRETGRTETGGAFALLSVSDTAASRALWPLVFRCDLMVRLEDDSLDTELRVLGTGRQALVFTTALHTYFAVADVSRLEARGLSGLSYIDMQDRGRVKREAADPVRVEAEVGRIYVDTPPELALTDPAGGKRIVIAKRGYPEAVLWNPWHTGSGRFADLGPEEFRRFVCLESGAINRSVTVHPGRQWSAGQTLRMEPLG